MENFKLKRDIKFFFNFIKWKEELKIIICLF